MVDNSSWRSLCFITPLFNTWPRFWSARMISFLLILVCCYLKTLKCAWELCSQLLLQACIARVVKSLWVHFKHLYFFLFCCRITAWFVYLWENLSLCCKAGCGQSDQVDAQEAMLSSLPQRQRLVMMCRQEGGFLRWAGQQRGIRLCSLASSSYC